MVKKNLIYSPFLLRKGLDIKDQLVPEYIPNQKLEGDQCEQYTLITIRNQGKKALDSAINGNAGADKYNPYSIAPVHDHTSFTQLQYYHITFN